ncbi:hypothetical protein LguiA_002057 [Lonicera macranthoides]
MEIYIQFIQHNIISYTLFMNNMTTAQNKSNVVTNIFNNLGRQNIPVLKFTLVSATPKLPTDGSKRKDSFEARISPSLDPPTVNFTLKNRNATTNIKERPNIHSSRAGNKNVRYRLHLSNNTT